MTIGTRIKKLRQEENISQVELAHKVGISKQTLYKYENDIITNIPSDKIELLSKELNTSPAYLMGWSDNRNNDVYAEFDAEFIRMLIDAVENATLLPSKNYIIYEDGEDDKLEDLFYSLNASGRKKAIEQLELLTKIPEYCDNTIPIERSLEDNKK